MLLCTIVIPYFESSFFIERLQRSAKSIEVSKRQLSNQVEMFNSYTLPANIHCVVLNLLVHSLRGRTKQILEPLVVFICFLVLAVCFSLSFCLLSWNEANPAKSSWYFSLVFSRDWDKCFILKKCRGRENADVCAAKPWKHLCLWPWSMNGTAFKVERTEQKDQMGEEAFPVDNITLENAAVCPAVRTELYFNNEEGFNKGGKSNAPLEEKCEWR